MEIRQVGQENIVAVQVVGFFQALIVGADVAVGQLHALGIFFAAAGEQDEQGIVFVAAMDRFQQALGALPAISAAFSLSRTETDFMMSSR